MRDALCMMRVSAPAVKREGLNRLDARLSSVNTIRMRRTPTASSSDHSMTDDEEERDYEHRLARRDDGGRLGAADRLRQAPQRAAREGARVAARLRLGAVLLFDQNNIRYVSSTHIGEWARDKSARCVLLPREGDPVLWDFGSAAKHHQLYAPWLPESSWQAGVTSMRGAMPRETGMPDALAGADPPRARRARPRRRAAGHRPDGHGDALLAAPPGASRRPTRSP